ncbi:DUF2628 domain-containing protein [Oceanisphaera sp. W20_SRM_FM3]|uniref:DUF2628 domain-containing protein n=1 Tax=Oceanisphaera sp. W20_SRM_FM3 TaxID=3240267 RepID=UPI003F987D35
MTKEDTNENNFSTLDVNEKWKLKFNTLKNIGADDNFIYKCMSSTEYKNLPFKEKQKVSFNILAFLFGPLYYFFKKMWLKGAVILGGVWIFASLLTLVEATIGIILPSVFYWIPSGVVCAQLANYDFYRKKVHSENMWQDIPSIFSTKVGAIGFPVIAFAVLIGISTLSPAYIEETKAQTLADVSGIWRADSGGEVITLSLFGKKKSISVDNVRIPVTVKSVDLDNNITTIGYNQADGQHVSWAIRQHFDTDGSFTLGLTLHDGSQEHLSFIRSL